MISKVCSKCGIEKPFSGFYRRKDRKLGRVSKCKECTKQESRRNNNTEAKKRNSRKWHLKRYYGITLDKYNEMFNKQNGLCAICGKHQVELKQRLQVDHCHKSEKVRGLLCPKCNSKLGQYEAGKEWFKNNKKYVLEYLKINLNV